MKRPAPKAAEISSAQVLPGDVAKAVRLLRGALSESLSMRDLADRCGVPERTLTAHFNRFIGEPPMQHLRRMRLAAVRKTLLADRPVASVTEVAQRFMFAHPGRFAAQYRRAFGETPSETLGRARAAARRASGAEGQDGLFDLTPQARERPTVAVQVDGPASRPLPNALSGIAGVVASRLSTHRWLAVVLPSSGAHGRSKAGYLLKLRASDHGTRLRLSFELTEAVSGKLLLGGHVDGAAGAPFELQDRLGEAVRDGIGSALRRAEIGRARHRVPRELDARGLAMRSLPLLFTGTPEGAFRALELLDRASDADPDDALPMALAAWGHAQQVMYNAAYNPGEARDRARSLARRAAVFADDDPVELTARSAVHMMLGDFGSADDLLARALAQDPSNGWAWSRIGWLQTYRGASGPALRSFRQALRFGLPGMRANTLLGIGAAHFNAGRYLATVQTLERVIREQPAAAYCNRSLSVSYARLGARDEALRSVHRLRRVCPGITVRDIVAAVPFQADFLERLANGLDDLGLPP